MKTDNPGRIRSDRVWLTEEDCRLDDFLEVIARTTDAADYPHAASVVSNVPVYDCAAIRRAVESSDGRKSVLAEWVEVMLDGPGIIVLAGAFPDTSVIDEATELYRAMIAEQHATNTGGGDHFAKPGANDRIWNALEKHCLRDPASFARYYANDMIALASEAWLGPCYQITSQLNVVNPGGEAQSVHRDYHLGFRVPEEIERYPRHVHSLSPVLTLQGAVAHCDMPVESGPTLYLPFSQAYEPGYLAWRKPEFKAYFEANHVQLPLAKGDAVFFNPALFHAAGHNRTSHIRRMANLLQVSSAFGRAMETVDRTRMSEALYPVLRAMMADGALGRAGIANAVAASAEGYAFPTNLDRDPPIGGLAPKTQQDLMMEALEADWTPEVFAAALHEQARRRLT